MHQALEMCAKPIGRTQARDDMKLIRSFLFGLEKQSLEARPKSKHSGFCELLCVGAGKKDVLVGVWDLARLARDVRM